MKDVASRLKEQVRRMETADATLASELKAVRTKKKPAREEIERRAPMLEATTESLGDSPERMALETIVLRVGRPVLAVQRDEPKLEFRDAESEVWRARLTAARGKLVPAIRAVGRIEVAGHEYFSWIGTGWLVKPDVVVTNRHVAAEFGRRRGERFVFRRAYSGGSIAASIDFIEEFDRPDRLEFNLHEILHIEDADGPDVAFLRVKPVNGHMLADPIPLTERAAAVDQQVAVIGYPARDSRIPDLALMEDIFGNQYDKKRLAPGQVTRSDSERLHHDCSTLGGNSGSAVVDLATGAAVAIHFAGRFLEANYAVPAAVIADRLQRALRGEARTPVPRPPRVDRPVDVAVVTPGAATAGAAAFRSIATCTIPLRVTLEIGAPQLGTPAAAPTVLAPRPAAGAGEIEDDVVDTEATAADYAGRQGYDAAFLGDGLSVPLPKVTRRVEDVLEFDGADGKTSELKYQHFSVVMNRRRRMCVYSAVNLDGGRSLKVKRVGWRRDPRIPADLQISNECYGPAPRFSRGHMTRREDPVWGTKKEASIGNADSMHVTNAVPQMQSFNAGIWLGLEDYALDHAREDDMRLCVFTGPFLLGNDPVRYDVKIPRSFWKVIAFIHDETGELCATGYTMSQDDFLREEEFIFGQHRTSQVVLSWIEERAGLSFGALGDADPLGGEEEAMVGPRPLEDFGGIQFVRR